MRILYIHQYFCTRAGRSGTRSYEFAKDLLRRGHRVTMLTSDSDLSDIRLGPGQNVARLDVEGIEVVAVRVGYSQHMSPARRLQSFLRFMVLSSWMACRARGHDVVVATSTPLTVGVPGLLAHWVHHIPLVFEVRDLWPEAPIQMGVVRNRLVIAALRAFERLVYRCSARVIALSPGMRDGVVAAGTPERKVATIPNCSDLDLFHPGSQGDAVRARYGLEGRFVVAYAGSMGEANGIDLLVDAATELQARGHDDIAFLLVGQGKQAEAVRREVDRRGLRRVVFAGSLPRRDVALVLQASHACAVLFRNLPVLATNSPNKLFDALAAGRAVIVNSDGWTRRLVEEHGVGVYAEPGSAAALAERIRWLSRHPGTCADMGRRARRLAERDFDRLELAGRFEAVLRASCAGLPEPLAAAPPAAPPVPPPARRREPAPAEAEARLPEPAGIRRRI